MSLRRSDVAVAFATFKAAGCRPPADHASDEGLDFALRVWVAVLADLVRDELLELVIAYVRTPGSKWWPTPGQLLALRHNDADDALEQWGRLLRLISSKGRNNPPVAVGRLDLALGEDPIGPWSLGDEPELDEAMRAGLDALGGWRLACAMNERDQTASRAAFRDAYRSSGRRSFLSLERQAVAAIAAGPPPMLPGEVKG